MNVLNQIIQTFQTSVFEHFGTDLLATVLIFYSMYLWGKKKRSGFIINIVACVLWVVWHVHWGSVFGAVMNGGLVFMNYWGWKRWKE